MTAKGIYPCLFLIALTACTKEIDFDYHDVEPVLMIEGRVTNEGSEVTITRTRNMENSIKNPCLTGAEVVITADGVEERLPFDPYTDCYRSALCGTVGKTYHLDVEFEGCHYEATSTMPAPAPVKSAEFIWQPVMKERLLAYEVWAVDPEPDVRNYYWYRMDRRTATTREDISAYLSATTDAYRWNVFDDRGCPPGLIYRDVMCMSERAADENEKENWKSILYEGDTITFTLMTIDRPTYDFFRSLRSGQSGGGANPTSNITGDNCLGYFTATSITHADTLRFSYSNIRQN